VALCAALGHAGTAVAAPKNPDLLIWDNNSPPPTQWEQAYPVGNGRLGAMPFSQFPNEKILINEETLWARQRDERFHMPADSPAHLRRCVELDASGKFKELDEYFTRTLQRPVAGPDPYQLFGWLDIRYETGAVLDTVHRELDLKTGVATTVYTLEPPEIDPDALAEANADALRAQETTITQRVFASRPDDVLVVHITADRDIGAAIRLKKALADNGDLVKDAATTGKNATTYRGIVRCRPAGVAKGDAIDIEDANDITLFVSIATDFDRTDSSKKRPKGWRKEAAKTLNAIQDKPLEAIERDAVANHRKYFDRVSIDFGRTDDDVLALPTPERLGRIKRGRQDDPDLIETYVQFGRYLLVASSRPGTFPANLQGIWNPHAHPPWSSDYHLNINIQMNYWPAETMHLGELHQPLFDFIRYCQPNGRQMARELGMAGWCMGHATDLWAHARIMAATPYWGGSFLGGQWMTCHILEHHRFSRDKTFLADHWDLLTASTAFVLSWLIPHPEHKEKLVARPACSPENSFRYTDSDGRKHKAALSSGNTFDQFMVLQVFGDYMEAAEALGRTDDPLVKKVKATIPKVYRPQIADDGRLMEWRRPFAEAEPGHRHMSHLIGAYPGNQIDLDDDPEMRSAVVKVIQGRLDHGGGGTGWSRAWIIGMFARLSDARRAYQHLHAILKRCTTGALWDTHPPLQIDGNFGATAAVAEMLLHSHSDEIKLLPALPEQWPDGHARGLRARGDFTIDLAWNGGSLTEATIRAGSNALPRIPVVYKGKKTVVKLQPGASATIAPDDLK
jgi:alpha-L-fucosidase 2